MLCVCVTPFPTLSISLCIFPIFSNICRNHTHSSLLSPPSLPPKGNGIDCHRTWEAVAFGCVAVVQSSPLNEMYLVPPSFGRAHASYLFSSQLLLSSTLPLSTSPLLLSSSLRGHVFNMLVQLILLLSLFLYFRYRDLPILFVRDWREVSEETLRLHVGQLRQHNDYRWDKLSAQYWVDLVRRGESFRLDLEFGFFLILWSTDLGNCHEYLSDCKGTQFDTIAHTHTPSHSRAHAHSHTHARTHTHLFGQRLFDAE